jgi:signal transduction histidine kinase
VRSTGLAVELECSGEPFALSEAAELTVYRIVQEALTNALKHAVCAHSARISLSFEDPDVSLTVIDDGQSPPPALLPASAPAGRDRTGGGHGIVGMVERAAAFDGTLTAGPRVEGGWQVAATLRGCRAPALL